jgi:hypothetical protein
VGEAAQQRQALLVGLVQVVDHEQHRPGRRDGVEQVGDRLEEQVPLRLVAAVGGAWQVG